MSRSSDGREIAKRATRAGCDITTSTDRGITTWTATHPNHPDMRIRWTNRSGIQATLRRIGDAIGDKTLAGRPTHTPNNIKAYRAEMRARLEHHRQAKRLGNTPHSDPIERRETHGPLHPDPTEPPLIEQLQRVGYSIDRHAIQRIIERRADNGSILRALLRPEIVRDLTNGHQLRTTPFCKVYVDPTRRRILTIV